MFEGVGAVHHRTKFSLFISVLLKTNYEGGLAFPMLASHRHKYPPPSATNS